MNQIVSVFFLLNSLAICVLSQQNYSGKSAQDCNRKDQTGKSPTYLYSCNGQYPSCQTFLILTSQPDYNSVSTISNLTSANPEELARINNVTGLTVFPANREVIVPVFCSCMNQYYQAKTRFILRQNDTYSFVANHVYQGLSPCSSVMLANPHGEFDLHPNMELQVPLRCACPTSNQSANGIKYLVTFSLGGDDKIQDIAKRFNVSSRSILDANGFSEENPILSPSTAILIPLPTEPSSSQTIVRMSYNNSTSISSPPTGSNPTGPKGRKKLYVIFAIEAVCALLVLSAVLYVAILFHKKRSSTKSIQRGDRGRAKRVSPDDLRVEIASFEKVLHLFGFEEVKKSTQDFSSKNRIKGCVYYGVFGRETLAVKNMSKDASNEVNILKKINHFNLIKLEGVCTYQQRFYLVFEYMEKGSLREWLNANNNSNSNSKETLSWARRIQIALDVAQGLNYLHSFTEPAYVHKNIKTSNILLNANLRAKIANFSLAGAAKKETASCSLRTHVVGTRGYLAPEYLEMGLATPKMDVYAFGVVVLELITGQNASIKRNGRKVLLSEAVVSIMEGDSAEAELGLLIDPVLQGENRIELAMRIAKLSVACLMRERERRPNMEEVVSSLLKIQADLLQIQADLLNAELVLDVYSNISG